MTSATKATEVTLRFVKCTALAEEDPFSANDPFVKVLLLPLKKKVDGAEEGEEGGAQDPEEAEALLLQTEPLEDTKNPTWPAEKATTKALQLQQAEGEQEERVLLIQVYDHDTASDDLIGQVELTVSALDTAAAAEDEVEHRLLLKKRDEGEESRGTVVVALKRQLVEVVATEQPEEETKPTSEEEKPQEEPEASASTEPQEEKDKTPAPPVRTAPITVAICQCTGLEEEDVFTANDPYVVVQYRKIQQRKKEAEEAGKEEDDAVEVVFQTPVLEDTKTPTWYGKVEDSKCMVAIPPPPTSTSVQEGEADPLPVADEIVLLVKDHDPGNADDLLGTTRPISLGAMMETLKNGGGGGGANSKMSEAEVVTFALFASSAAAAASVGAAEGEASKGKIQIRVAEGDHHLPSKPEEGLLFR